NELAPGKNGTYHYGDSFDVTGDAQVIDGYVLVKQENTAGTFGDGNQTAKFIYKQVGKIIPVDEAGNPIPGAATPSYSNDQNDPAKVLDDEPIPVIPGYTPVDPGPITPTDAGKDTFVPYTQNKYQLTEQFVDENGNELAPSKNSSYHYGDSFDVTGDAQVIDGYVLVEQENTAGTFGDGNQTAKFVYKQVGKIIPVDEAGNPIPGANTPSYSNDSTDPTKVVPNETVPTVPGYTPSATTVTPTDPTKDTPVTYTQNEYQLTERFVDENGNELAPGKNSTYHYGDSFDVTGDAQVIDGYVLIRQENTAGTFGDGDQTAKFVYKQVGRIIPVDEAGNPIPGANTPSYSNDPTDPTKVVPNETVPTVPGYKPSVTTVTPTDPTKDTPVTCVKNQTPTTPNTPEQPQTPADLVESLVTPNIDHSMDSVAVENNAKVISSHAKDNDAKRLPQTGNDQHGSVLTIIGLALAGLGFGIGRTKKRKL
ncbi:MucBP domain-containing protein, partial [Limosilactobacillus mucosae]|uniref:MucBP domain-containing protein n=1 Tax=Limosilactobacillus mucosae TaxID=97478 RepID=UPI00233F1A8F